MYLFTDFKGFKEAELNLFEPLTVLIGPNGSGKSNVIEAVELLSGIAHGQPLHEIEDVRGGLQSCPRYGRDSFTLGFSASINFENYNRPFSYSVTIQVKPKIRISEEKLVFDDGTIIFQTGTHFQPSASSDIEVEFNNFARGHNPKVNISANRSALSQYEEFAKIRNKNKYIASVGIVGGIKGYLHSSFVFDPNPKLMRAYERMSNNILTRNGSNLSAVLYSLIKEKSQEKITLRSLSERKIKEQKTLERLLGWIKQLPEEPYQKIDFVTTELNDVIFGFREGDDGYFMDARMLSDGTLRCLAVLTALETVDEGSRVVIEEFDNGLHPSRVDVLIQAIVSCCKKRKLNVLVTTHNPASLNALQTEQLKGVVLCSWNKAEQAFKLIRLNDLPRYDELIERGRLGDMVSRQVIDQYLKPKFEEEHKEKSLKWLRSLP